MSTAATGIMVECEGGCGVYVRPENRFCDECARLNHLLELKRLGKLHLTRRAPCGEYVRQDLGVGLCEDPDLPTILATMSLRERVTAGLVYFGMMGAMTLGAFLLWLGARVALGWVLVHGL